jgi:hypothetical protein
VRGAVGAGPAPPKADGGATPTIVPFNLGGMPPAPTAGLAPTATAPGCAATPAAPGPLAAPPTGRGGAGVTPPDWFIIIIVPLNFGAAAPFKLKLHLEQFCDVSGF